jgi:hypothetical protein
MRGRRDESERQVRSPPRALTSLRTGSLEASTITSALQSSFALLSPNNQCARWLVRAHSLCVSSSKPASNPLKLYIVFKPHSSWTKEICFASHIALDGVSSIGATLSFALCTYNPLQYTSSFLLDDGLVCQKQGDQLPTRFKPFACTIDLMLGCLLLTMDRRWCLGRDMYNSQWKYAPKSC